MLLLTQFQRGGVHLGIKSLIKGDGYWFLYALFTAKIIYYVLDRIIHEEKYVWITSIIIFIIGFICLEFHLKEYWNYIHAMLLLPCLSLGRILRKKVIPLNIKSFLVSLPLYVLMIAYCLYNNFRLPGVTGGIELTVHTLIPYFVLSITGSIVFLYLCKILNESTLLESLGKNSLIIYCVHVPFITLWGSIIGAYLSNFEMNEILYAYISILISVTFISYVISRFISLKYIRVIIGKF